MSQGLPCINPICDHTFSLADIRGATSLTCPRCGNVCQLGSGATAAPALAPPAARLTTPEPAARAVPVAPPAASPSLAVPLAARTAALPALPRAMPADEASTETFTPTPSLYARTANDPGATVAFTDPPVAQRIDPGVEESSFTENHAFSTSGTTFINSEPPSAFAGGAPLTRESLERRRQPLLGLWQRIVLGFALAGLFLGLPLMAIVFGLFSFQGSDSDEDIGSGYKGYFFNDKKAPELAFRLGVPSDQWKEREDMKDLFKAAIALEREYLDPKTQKEALILLVVAGQDYGKQKPRDSELLKQAVAKLEKCFGNNLIADTTPEETKVDGKRALALTFQGSLNSVDYLGKCYALTHHGFGYWVFVLQNIPAGVDQDLAEKLFEQIQSQKKMGFRIVTKRKGWTEQPLDLTTYASETGKLKIQALQDRWELEKATDVDPHGEVFIRSKEKRKYQLKHEQEATILVLALDKKTLSMKEAVKAATEYVEQRKKDLNESFRLIPMKEGGKEKDLPKKVGNQMGQILEFEMESGDKDYKKYIMMGVIHRPNQIYVIQCESFWQYRQSWRGDFIDMLSTFKLGEE